MKPAKADTIGLVVASAEPSTLKQVTVAAQPTIADVALNTASLPASHPDPSELELTIKSGKLKTNANQPASARSKVAAKIFKTATELDHNDIKAHLKSWNIQIGAFPTPQGAQSRLDKAVQKASANLRGKKPFTMRYAKDGDVYFRARFSGFNRRTAQKACRTLTRKGLGCFALAPRG